MEDCYAVFDVETPNSRNDRISAIGVVLVEGGVQTTGFYSLVDPQTEFDAFNIRLTGITPWMVRGKPDFQALWPRLRPLLERGVLCAHNAPFDTGFINCELSRLSLPDLSQNGCEIFDTLRLARRLYPNAHRGLNDLCIRFGIDITGRALHGALLDSELLACVYPRLLQEQREQALRSEIP
jgi:DNA polymerase-3 subunit epsilon